MQIFKTQLVILLGYCSAKKAWTSGVKTVLCVILSIFFNHAKNVGH